MNEQKIVIEFTNDEFEKILKYMEMIEAETVQEAIVHAVTILT